MSKWRRFDQALTAKQASQETNKTASKPIALVCTLAALIVAVGITAYAANEQLRGHIVTERRITTAQTKPVRDEESISKAAGSKSSELVNQYGEPADSPAVAAAIRKAESAPKARRAADRFEAIQHGAWKSGTDPNLAIMHGYSPPNMDSQQARMLYSALPHLPQSPRTGPMTPEMADQLAGGPPEPSSVSQESVRAANQEMVESHMRQRFGPIYVPPLHREPNQMVSQKDNQMSLIEPEYSLDSGNGPPKSIREMTDSSGNVVSQYEYDSYGRQAKISGTGPDADFGYAGMYVHQRSGLNLTPHRAYNPAIGRWLSRDPVHELGFNHSNVSQEPLEPMDPRSELGASKMPSLRRLAANPVIHAQLAAMKIPKVGNSYKEHNLYTYVVNNPVNFSDPSGLMMGGGKTKCCKVPPLDDFTTLGQCLDWCYENCINDYEYQNCWAACWERFGPKGF